MLRGTGSELDPNRIGTGSHACSIWNFKILYATGDSFWRPVAYRISKSYMLHGGLCTPDSPKFKFLYLLGFRGIGFRKSYRSGVPLPVSHSQAARSTPSLSLPFLSSAYVHTSVRIYAMLRFCLLLLLLLLLAVTATGKPAFGGQKPK